MFKLLAQKLLDAGTPPEIVDVVTKCTENLEHDGTLFDDYQWPPNANPNKWGAIRVRTNPHGTALLVDEGNSVFGGNVLFFNDVAYNGTGTVIRFRNDSGEVVPVGGIMKITGDVIRNVDGRQLRYLTIAKPNNTADADSNAFDRLYAINGRLPIQAGDYGICSTSGLCVCSYDTGNAPVMRQEWGPKDGSWRISKGGYGFTIEGTGRNGLVQCNQREITHCRATLNGTLAAGGSVAAAVNSDNGSAFTILLVDDMLVSGALATSTVMGASWEYGKWRPNVSKGCPA